MKKYPIAEHFLSAQGEGCHMGRRAYFVRMFGCNVKCPWCDSKIAWEGRPACGMSAEEILGAVKSSRAEIVVITGGEPCIHDLIPILKLLNSEGIKAHLETSGTLPILEREGARFDWVALSPKLFCPPLEKSLLRADELKLIVSSPDELDAYLRIISAARASSVWLHPEWGMARDRSLLKALSDFVEKNGGPFRLGWQLHKNFFVR